MAVSQTKATLEILAVFEGSVIDVRHLRPRQARTSARTFGVLGGVLLVVGIGLFLSQTLGQQSMWTAYASLAAQAAATGQQPPIAPTSQWVGLALSLGLFGLVSLAVGFVRASDLDTSVYTIGEGTDAALATPPVNLLTPDAFVLARINSRGAAGLRFTADMTGEIVVAGRSYTLREWTQDGRAVSDDGALGTTLSPGARCRIGHGNLVFHIAVVDAAVVSARRYEPDVSFWAATGASSIGIGSLLLLAQYTAPAAGGFDLDDRERGRRFVGYVQQPPRVRMPTRPRVVPELQDLEPQKMVHPGRAVLWPDVVPVMSMPKRVRGRGASRRTADVLNDEPVPTIFGRRSVTAAGALMARGTGPVERAAQAGALAYVDTSSLNHEYSGAFSPDADDRAMWQAAKDRDPMMKSVAGLELIGKGRGGGPDSTEGIVGSAPAAEPDGDGALSLKVRFGSATGHGPRTPGDVRRHVRKHAAALRRCFEEGEVPRRRITLKLEIDDAGAVIRASIGGGRFADPSTNDCISRAARSWSFPASDTQRRSVVSVPLKIIPG